jgi:hypothetical protein
MPTTTARNDIRTTVPSIGHLLVGINVELFDEPKPNWEPYHFIERNKTPMHKIHNPFDPTQDLLGSVNPNY